MANAGTISPPQRMGVMGSFDTVWVDCRRCGKQIGFQSKAGDCLLKNYSVWKAPVEILGKLNGTTKDCVCGETVKIRVGPPQVHLDWGPPPGVFIEEYDD